MSYQSTANASVIERIDAEPMLDTFNDEFILPQVSFNNRMGRRNRVANNRNKKKKNKGGNKKKSH